MTTLDTLRLAAVQLCSGQDREQNLARARALMVQAVEKGAQLIALPEDLPYLGRDTDKIDFVEDTEAGPTVSMLREFAREHQVGVVGGTIPFAGDEPGKVTNSCLVFGPSGETLARYDKMHLFDVAVDEANTFRESAGVTPGDRVVTVELFGHKMGLSICYDLRFPELYRALAVGGAEVLFVPSAFTRKTGRDHWEVLLRARAIENLCYVVASAQWGEHGLGRESWGQTSVIGPWGDVVAELREGEGVIFADVDFAEVAKARRRIPSLSNRRLG